MSRRPTILREQYDALLLDLDGTLYLGDRAIDGAAKALGDSAQRIVYVTNNASRSAETVASHLNTLGFQANPATVVTAAQAAAMILAEHVPADSEVLVVGTVAFAHEIEEVGLRPTRTATNQTAAVAQGYSPATDWSALAEAGYAIRAGAFWVATNRDATLPTERGLAPGNGSLVAALVTATKKEPITAGKPEPFLLNDGARRANAERPLVIGDRLDTDILGAERAGMDSLLVLSADSTIDDVLAANSPRPTYIATTLDALNQPAEHVRYR